MVDRVSELPGLQELAQRCISSPAIKTAAYGCKLSQKELEKLVEELLPHIQKFIRDRFLHSPKQQNAEILSVCDIEDMFWNPAFGIKGKLDASVKIRSGYKERVGSKERREESYVRTNWELRTNVKYLINTLLIA